MILLSILGAYGARNYTMILLSLLGACGQYHTGCLYFLGTFFWYPFKDGSTFINISQFRREAIEPSTRPSLSDGGQAF